MKKIINSRVHQMIMVHTYFLLKTAYFTYDEKEDITQELCLFYLEKFVCQEKNKDDNLIFHALKGHAINMLNSKRCQKRNPLRTVSFDEMTEDYFDFPSLETIQEKEDRIDLHSAILKLNEREQKVCQMVLNGANLEEIRLEMNISKNTIYKIFNTLKKHLNF